MNAVHISSGGRKWNINRERRKRKLPKVATSHATDAEDVMQDMLAAAASQGGRAWKKKKKLLEKREKRRHDASIAEATRSIQKQAKALAKKNRKSGMCAPVSRSELLLLPSSEPFQRCFWPANSRGTHGDSEEPSDALKEYRRSLGIRVALHGNQTDVLGRYCPPPIARVDDPSLPAIFPAFFQVLQQQWQEEHKTKRGIRPTVVQRQAWPALLSGSDCLVVSPTGSGKTLAYLLPLVPHVLAQKAPRPGEGPLAVVLVPTRELAQQVKHMAAPLRRLCGWRSMALYGGLLKHQRQAQVAEILEQAVHLVVATPGRLADLASATQGNVEAMSSSSEQGLRSPRIPLRRVSFLVLDEADRMLSLGFEQQLLAIAQNIRTDRQTACFSATFPQVLRAAALQEWVGKSSPTVSIRIAATSASSTITSEDIERCTDLEPNFRGDLESKDANGDDVEMSSTIVHKIEVVPTSADKPRALLRYLNALQKHNKIEEKGKDEKVLGGRDQPSVLVFCNRVSTAISLAEFLASPLCTGDGRLRSETTDDIRDAASQTRGKKHRHRAGALHGKMPQSQRDEILKQFARGQVSVLVATDLAARGIHVRGLGHVVNFDIPHEGRVSEQYPHRVGRTGRNGRSGTALTLLAEVEDVGSLPRCSQSTSSSSTKSGGDSRRSGGGAVRELLRLFAVNGVPVDPSLVELLGEDGDSEDESSRSVDDSQDESDSFKESVDVDDDFESGGEHVDSDFNADSDADSGDNGSGGELGEGGCAVNWTRQDLREELMEFYVEHAPEKLGDVNSLVEKYWGKIEPQALLSAMKAKYAV